MNKDEIINGLKKQAEICSATSLLYRDILNFCSTQEDICNLILEISKEKNFTTALEASLTFIAYFHFRALENHPIKNYYKSYGGNYSEAEYASLCNIIKDIFTQEIVQIKEWLKKTILQTNEIARSAVIYPSILNLGLNNINLIELGASAGLILYMDKYSYKFSQDNKEFLSEAEMPVISSKVNNLNSFDKLMQNRDKLNIEKRLGFDLNPIDLNQEYNIKLLKSAIWDSPERLSRLENAIEIFKEYQDTAPVINSYADYTKDLADKILSLINPETDTVIYTSVSTYQISDSLYQKLREQLNILKSKVKNLYFIEFEPPRQTEHLNMSLSQSEPFNLKVSNLTKNEEYIFAKAHFHGVTISLL